MRSQPITSVPFANDSHEGSVKSLIVSLVVTGQIAGTVDGTDHSLKVLEIRSLEVTSSSLFSMGLSGRVHLVGSPHGEGHIRVNRDRPQCLCWS